jgi:hypothetical protein
MRTRYYNLVTTGQVLTGLGVLAGMYVNSTTSGTLRFLDYTSDTGTAWAVGGILTPAAGYHNLGSIIFNRGCFVRVGGTIDVTFHILDAE